MLGKLPDKIKSERLN